jgi:hypothetical protein
MNNKSEKPDRNEVSDNTSATASAMTAPDGQGAEEPAMKKVPEGAIDALLQLPHHLRLFVLALSSKERDLYELVGDFCRLDAWCNNHLLLLPMDISAAADRARDLLAAEIAITRSQMPQDLALKDMIVGGYKPAGYHRAALGPVIREALEIEVRQKSAGLPKVITSLLEPRGSKPRRRT